MELRELDYDAYRDIRYRPRRPSGGPRSFRAELMFFHQGRTVPEPVRINVIEPLGRARRRLDPALFDYGKNKFEPQTLSGSASTAFAVHYAINKPGYKDEVVVFQGASYFRRRRQGPDRTDCRHAAWRSTPPPRQGEEFPASSNSGSSGRAPARPR